MVESHFNRKLSRRWLTVVIDRKDSGAKLFFMPKTILKAVADYQDNEFHKFHKFEGAPMPYDVIIKAKNAGTIEGEYTMMASPNNGTTRIAGAGTATGYEAS